MAKAASGRHAQDAVIGFAGSKPATSSMPTADCKKWYIVEASTGCASCRGFRRHGGDGPLDWPRAGDGRGFSFDQSQFNARRRPTGSRISPNHRVLVAWTTLYAIDVVVDAPIEIDQGKAGVSGVRRTIRSPLPRPTTCVSAEIFA